MLLDIRREFPNFLDPSEIKAEVEGGKVVVRSLVLDTTKLSAEDATDGILEWLRGQVI